MKPWMLIGTVEYASYVPHDWIRIKIFPFSLGWPPRVNLLGGEGWGFIYVRTLVKLRILPEDNAQDFISKSHWRRKISRRNSGRHSYQEAIDRNMACVSVAEVIRLIRFARPQWWMCSVEKHPELQFPESSMLKSVIESVDRISKTEFSLSIIGLKPDVKRSFSACCFRGENNSFGCAGLMTQMKVLWLNWSLGRKQELDATIMKILKNGKGIHRQWQKYGESGYWNNLHELRRTRTICFHPKWEKVRDNFLTSAEFESSSATSPNGDSFSTTNKM